VEFLRFGPLVEQNRAEQFFFWPDPRGVVQRQMRAVLAGGDAALLEASGLRAQSVAVQGLPALEYALHADDAARTIAAGGADGRYRCAYALAVASNLARLAGEIAAGWKPGAPLAAEFARPAAGNNVYRSAGEVATEVLKALSTALHVARDQKLQPALGDNTAAARGTLLPLYRSGLTQRYLVAGIEALAQFHVAAGLGATLPAGSAWMDAGVRDELRRVQEDLTVVSGPLDRAVADETQRDLLVHAALLLVNARAIVDEYLAPALGVNLGFNALDGD
jgi:predicted lipoprotein